MDSNYTKIYAAGCTAPLKIRSGHFATNHSHINYHIDTTTLRTRTNEAQEIARSLAGTLIYSAAVDTILCLEGTAVIGAYLSEELSKSGVLSMNMHKTIYVITPEYNSDSQMIFRENILPMVRDKNVILLATSVTTGLSVNKGVEAIQYYGGKLQGIAAVFSLIDDLNGCKVISVFGRENVPGYASYTSQECPFCRQGQKLDALVNTLGYSNMR